jgi:hypothetical protein
MYTLAATAFTYYSECFAFLEDIGDIVNGMDSTLLCIELGNEVVDL